MSFWTCLTDGEKRMKEIHHCFGEIFVFDGLCMNKTDSAFEKKNKKDEVPHAWSRSRRAKVERGQVTPAHRCSLENRSEPSCRDSTAGEYTKLSESARFDPGSRINFDTPAREEWTDLRVNTGSWEFIKICFFSSALIILFGKKCTFPKNQSMLFLVDA